LRGSFHSGLRTLDPLRRASFASPRTADVRLPLCATIRPGFRSLRGSLDAFSAGTSDAKLILSQHFLRATARRLSRLIAASLIALECPAHGIGPVPHSLLPAAWPRRLDLRSEDSRLRRAAHRAIPASTLTIGRHPIAASTAATLRRATIHLSTTSSQTALSAAARLGGHRWNTCLRPAVTGAVLHSIGLSHPIVSAAARLGGHRWNT
jgi:hypothetical protein